MKQPHLIRILFLLALPLSYATHGSASPLHGKVVDVLDGERITIISVVHPLKVKLLGIAAPVKGQPYSDVAAQHLSQLISGKFVGAHCAGLEADGYLRCRVMLDEMDVGEQMVRDGVAWYNKSEASDLSEQERIAYLGSEQAARREARGLWKDATPTAPWDFRREQETKQKIAASPLNEWTKSRNPSLASDDLLRTGENGRSAHRRRNKSMDPGWKTLAPKGGKFSVLVPGDAYDASSTRPTPDGKVAEVNYCSGMRGIYDYLVLWGKGPINGRTDDVVIDDITNGLMASLENSRNKFSSDVKFEAKRDHSVKLGPYSGWQYNISGPNTVGLIRIFVRRHGDELEIYLLGVMNGTENDPQVLEFLGSLSIDKF
jgi:endonuclease YncB( thermonuclease family)